MRKLSFALIAAFLLMFITTYSQENLKIGHVNIPELVQQLPETDSIQQVLKKESDDMEKMFNEMLEEHDSNVRKFESEKNSYSEFVRNSKEQDLMEMAAKIEQYQQNANQQLQKRNMELLQPVEKPAKVIT